MKFSVASVSENRKEGIILDIKEYAAGSYDVAVIGGGHAGVEAALAAARLGARTIMFTITLDWVANMPCNPSIGGTAKGHLVRELDALGGEMGKAADANTLQSRMLNRGKGPAVYSLRAQIDRRHYSEYMKHTVEKQKNLDVKQAEIVKIEKRDNVWHLVTNLGADFECKTVIFATGTFLGGRIYVGEVNYESGPDGCFPAKRLSKSIEKLGIPLRRFKTGTPARVLRESIDFSKLEVQEGDEETVPFSFSSDNKPQNKVVCHIAYTNDETKKVILDNIDRSPLYAGEISGVGPRYCPSIEDKIVRFADKKRHQLFIEPCGENTEEMYLQGMSSSLPEEVQIEFYKTIKGLENVKVMRNAYAIEYDCVDPTSLKASLEFKEFDGLFGAGQFNGSSGYEEAAAQGLIAGINAAKKIKGEEPLILSRGSSYIGTLIDDLVTKGCSDPYRMMTSRSEYRLFLRQDNADERLMPIGYDIGLVDKETYNRLQKKISQKESEITRVKNTFLSPSKELNDLLISYDTTPVDTGVSLESLIRRPQLNYKILSGFDISRPKLPDDVCEKVEIEIKYEGYIKRQLAQINEMLRLESKQIPKDIDYETVYGLRLEAKEKLNKIRPANIAQAGRISGVSPSDISVLLIHLKKG
ncbi:MAG: tRNA uridine-5-carboxymethylaminomethyl(34) synthesis enzyme MnmG [Clostridia bacterium]|nr:tRNA uridine-5-carboxymethylaminomethyl(34) synthesis enzyme MnmG [Clostridia bacterium]